MSDGRKNIDWESIEADYRTGQLSVNAIAKKHDISEGGVRKKAKLQGWQKDLTSKVRSQIKAKLMRGESTSTSTSTNIRTTTDDEIVEHASDEAVALVLKHRKGIGKYWQIADEFSGQLKGLEVTEDNYHTYSRSLNSGVDALAKAIKLERQAYNLDDQQEKQQTSSLADLMDSMEYPNIAVT